VTDTQVKAVMAISLLICLVVLAYTGFQVLYLLFFRQ